MYLLSRSELFRLIGLDTDKRFLIIGPDESFRKWIDVGVGKNTTISEHLPVSGVYDVVLCVSELNDGERAAVRRLLAPDGTVWELRKENDVLGTASIPFDPERTIARTI